VLPLFSKLFGEGDHHDVCAFGFEPNPRHTSELHSIEETYSMLGYPVKIFTRTAVSDDDGLATFFLDDNRRRNDWGATLLDNVHHPHKTKTVVRLMDFTSFILEELSPEAIILMKMDIEGAEYTILPSLMLSGALCKVNTVYMEWHRNFYPKGWVYGQKGASLRPEQIPGVVEYLTSHAKGCSTEFINLDDESYGRANIRQLPLPEIKVPIVAVDGMTTD
jgi:FkbM family methyltransferase